MANVAQLVINITANVNQANRAISGISNNVNNMANNIRNSTRSSSSQFNTLGNTIKSAFAVGAVVSGIYALEQAIGNVINSGINFNKTIQDTEMAFEVMTNGNIEKAKELTQQMIEMARTSPLSTQEVAKAGVTLNSFGVEADRLMGTLTALGNVARGDNDRFQRLSLAFGQMTSAGRLMGQETLQFINAGFNPLSAIADVLAKKLGGVAQQYMPQLKKSMEDGAISAEMVTQAFAIATSEGGKFYNSMNKMATTFSGQMNIMKDNVMILVGGALKPVMDWMASTFLPVINAILERLITVFKLFGIEIKANSNQATNSLQGFGDAMSQNAKDQKKNKKAMQSNIQSFDELHQLQKDATDSGSGNGIGGGGIGDLASIMDEASKGLKSGNPIEDAMKGTTEKVNQFFADLGKDINLSKITTAMNNLKTAFTPFASNVGTGLKWFWDNVLVPLGTWTANELLPFFLNSLSTVFSLLNTALEAFKPLGQWLWSSFLQPLASWTGGVVASTLDGITTALNSFSTWASNNKEVIAGITLTLAGFFGAWKLVELLAFIQMSGGLVTALNSIRTAVVANTLAKLADKAETIALTAMYAKDFVVSLAKSTASMIKNTASLVANKVATIATTLYTKLMNTSIITTTASWVAQKVAMIATTVATKAMAVAQNLLNLAMKANPISIVIGLVIALAGYLIYLWNTNEGFRNAVITAWNKIKEVAGTVWGYVEEKFKSVSDYITTKVLPKFNELKDGIVTAFESASTIIGNVWEGIKSTIKNSINSIIDFINSFITKYNSIKITIPSLTGGESTTVGVPQIPSIPRLAKGGIVTQPTMAMIGEGKYNEAVIPLGGSQMDILVNAIANAIVQGLGANQTSTNNANQNVVLNIDGKEFARIVTPYFEQEQKRKGISVVISN